jgi:serine/threonine/tyrosine protein kinase RAD53
METQPNIVKLVDNIRIDHQHQVVTEYVPYGDLHTMVDASRSTPHGAAKQIISQISSALQFLHSQSITHRDIKPENILIASKPIDPVHIKLADFGLARDKASNMDTFCGTHAYVAPEILWIQNEPDGYDITRGYSDRVDLWSLGILLYVILTKKYPLESDLKTLLKIKRGSTNRSNKINKEWTWEPLPGYPSIEPNWQPLLKGLLYIHPTNRFTAQQCLNHDALGPRPGETDILDHWMQEEGHDSSYYIGRLESTKVSRNDTESTIRIQTSTILSPFDHDLR